MAQNDLIDKRGKSGLPGDCVHPIAKKPSPGDAGVSGKEGTINISIIQATLDDASEIIALQKVAYQSEARLTGDWTIPPLMQTIVEIKAEFGTKVFLKAVSEGRIIGSIRVSLNSGSCSIGRLIVHPDNQGKGIGTMLMKSIENAFAGAERFELFTGVNSIDNIRLYKRLGYERYREENLSSKVRIVFMEKRQKG